MEEVAVRSTRLSRTEYRQSQDHQKAFLFVNFTHVFLFPKQATRFLFFLRVSKFHVTMPTHTHTLKPSQNAFSNTLLRLLGTVCVGRYHVEGVYETYFHLSPRSVRSRFRECRFGGSGRAQNATSALYRCSTLLTYRSVLFRAITQALANQPSLNFIVIHI